MDVTDEKCGMQADTSYIFTLDNLKLLQFTSTSLCKDDLLKLVNR